LGELIPRLERPTAFHWESLEGKLLSFGTISSAGGCMLCFRKSALRCCGAFSITDANFGKIVSALDPRIMQVAMKFTF
jgi:hypothetical protein